MGPRIARAGGPASGDGGRPAPATRLRLGEGEVGGGPVLATVPLLSHTAPRRWAAWVTDPGPVFGAPFASCSVASWLSALDPTVARCMQSRHAAEASVQLTRQLACSRKAETLSNPRVAVEHKRALRGSTGQLACESWSHACSMACMLARCCAGAGGRQAMMPQAPCRTCCTAHCLPA